MVFNNAARAILMKAGQQAKVAAHDWWVYQLVAGSGGQVHYDSYPSILYRQHSGNLVGDRLSRKRPGDRLLSIWRGRYKHWIRNNITELLKIENLLTPENRRTLKLFAHAHESSHWRSVVGVIKSGVYRGTKAGTAGLIAAALLNKL